MNLMKKVKEKTLMNAKSIVMACLALMTATTATSCKQSESRSQPETITAKAVTPAQTPAAAPAPIITPATTKGSTLVSGKYKPALLTPGTTIKNPQTQKTDAKESKSATKGSVNNAKKSSVKETVRARQASVDVRGGTQVAPANVGETRQGVSSRSNGRPTIVAARATELVRNPNRPWELMRGTTGHSTQGDYYADGYNNVVRGTREIQDNVSTRAHRIQNNEKTRPVILKDNLKDCM